MGLKQVADQVWLVRFMRYDLGYFDNETCRLESAESQFGAKVLPMCPEWTSRNGVSSSRIQYLRSTTV